MHTRRRPQTEGVVADTDEDAPDDVAVVEATVVPAEGSRTYAWSAVTSFRPARLQLESLPRATRQLSSLTLLWANDNALTTLPMLPPSRPSSTFSVTNSPSSRLRHRRAPQPPFPLGPREQAERPPGGYRRVGRSQRPRRIPQSA